jgi:hypothetical protein
MKQLFYLFIIVVALLIIACQKEEDEVNSVSKFADLKESIADTPIPLGCIRGNFNGVYLTFTQQIEKIQPIDSFSNVYFYGAPDNTLNQINLIRCDTSFYIALYILGYPLDSLPSSQPVAAEFCKYAEIQFSPIPNFSWGLPGHYVVDDFYGRTVFITDRTDDVLTGTFEGELHDVTGNTLRVTDGEFKIKIFRKYLP